MISNFNEVEKSLKRCLKEKVSINTATVVGFLIAGTVAFGTEATVTKEYTNENFSTAITEEVMNNQYGLMLKDNTKFKGVIYEFKFGEEKPSAIERLITVSKGKTTLDKDTNLSTSEGMTLLNIVGEDKTGITEVISEATLINNNSSLEEENDRFWRPTVIVNGFQGNTSFTNSGTITKTGHPTYNCAVDLSAGKDYTTTFTNSGIINGLIKSDADDRQLGNIVINLKDNSKINGEFSFAGGGTRTINIDNNTDDLTINNTADNETFVRTNNSNITLRGEIQSKGTTVELSNKDGDNILTNYADIIGKTGIGVANSGQDTDPSAENRTVKIINNGKVTASVIGIYNNGYYTKLNKIHIENNGDVLVNDFEKTTNGGKPYYYNTGIYSASNQDTKTLGKVVNNGNITIELSSKKQEELKSEYERTDGDMYLNIYGLRLHEHTEGYNNGEILINSYGGIGVVLSASDGNGINTRYGYFENNETVEVNGENGIGVKLNSKNNSIIESINTEKGSIAVSGKNVIGVRVEGESATFTNDGIITLKDGTTNGIGISIDKGTATNNGTIALGSGNLAIKNVDGTAKNAGKIKITDKTAKELKDFDISSLFTGNYINSGMLVDKDGKAIEREEDIVINGGEVNAGDINNAGGNGSIVIKGEETTIKGSTDQSIEVESLNVTGKVTIANGESNAPVEIKGTTTNLDASGSIAVGNGTSKADLTITNGTVNAEADKTAVTFAHADSTLELSGTSFNGNIGDGTTNGTLKTAGTEKATVITGDVKAKALELAGTTSIIGNIEAKTMDVTAGNTEITGTITGAETINIGVPTVKLFSLNRMAVPTDTEKATVTYSADSAIKGTVGSGTTVTIGADGMLKAEVDNDGKNLFGNSENVTVTGDGTIQFLTSNINKENLTLKLGNSVSIDGISNIITNSEFYSYNNGALSFIKGNVNNKELADMYNKSFVINNVLSQNKDVREAQLDSVYSNNVYSETVKMAMDTLRMNEDAVLSLGGKPEEGKWTAQGKILFSRTEYDRDGKVNNYGVETKTTGLLGAMEYGVSEKSSVGFAFSGTKQDLDMKNASADGDAFYFGVYGKQDVNNFKLTAGLGYQLDKIDADNNVIASTGDKYNSKAFSGYAQGKYVINAGNDVTVEPKVKLALTRLTQESVEDKHFEMEKVEATTFDTEVGVDLIKTIKLESGKMNLLAGISYTRSMGDTDNKFKGNFIGTDGTRGNRFDVLGANLGENTLKINIGAEVEKDNGIFYNGGINYKFDNEDRETLGATIGAGYKF
ncbi:autotransporter family protein [Fusobacterium ulcerans]